MHKMMNGNWLPYLANWRCGDETQLEWSEERLKVEEVWAHFSRNVAIKGKGDTGPWL